MAEYIPTTDQIRDAYVGEPAHFMDDLVRAEFDAWLAEHDREVQARALEEAAGTWGRGGWADVPRRHERAHERIAVAQHVTDWLRTRAAALRTPTEENPRG